MIFFRVEEGRFVGAVPPVQETLVGKGWEEARARTPGPFPFYVGVPQGLLMSQMTSENSFARRPPTPTQGRCSDDVGKQRAACIVMRAMV